MNRKVVANKNEKKELEAKLNKLNIQPNVSTKNKNTSMLNSTAHSHTDLNQCKNNSKLPVEFNHEVPSNKSIAIHSLNIVATTLISVHDQETPDTIATTLISNKNQLNNSNIKSSSYPSLPSVASNGQVENDANDFVHSQSSITTDTLQTRKTISTSTANANNSEASKKAKTKRRPSFQGKFALRHSISKRNHASLPQLQSESKTVISSSILDNNRFKDSKVMTAVSQHTTENMENKVHESVPMLFHRVLLEERRAEETRRRSSLQTQTDAMRKRLSHPNELLYSDRIPSIIRNQTAASSKYKINNQGQGTDASLMNDRNYFDTKDYYEFILMNQRRSNSFINRVDSNDIVHHDESQSEVKSIGPYILGDMIGKGSFGKVKEGIDSSTLSRVAVKIISKKRARKAAGGLENVYREIDMLRRLNKNSHVISLLGVYCKVEDENETRAVFNWFRTIEDEPIIWVENNGCETDKNVTVLKFYLIFDYCPCSLQTIIEQHGSLTIDYTRRKIYFERKVICRLLIQIADGILFLHSMGVIHRDIKPANILLTVDNIAKISDFGIAEQYSIYTNDPMLTSSFVGTHKFLSPEVLQSNSKYRGEPVDVWACGVTLYNMLTGKFPFESHTAEEGETLPSLYSCIMNEEFIPSSQVDGECKMLLTGMFKKDPIERFSMHQVLLHPFCFQNDTALVDFSPVMSYPLISGSQILNSKNQIEPVETTMTKYLELMHGSELRLHNKNVGTFENFDKKTADTIIQRDVYAQKYSGNKSAHQSWLKRLSIFSRLTAQ